MRWDLAKDGKRVLVVTPAAAETTKAEHHVVSLQNFFDELRRKVRWGSDGLTDLRGAP